MNVEAPPTTNASLGAGDLLLAALQERRPLVLVLGQDAWAESENGHSVLAKALDRLGRHDQLRRGWSALLGAEATPDEFDDWLAERFARRVHPQALEILSELPWSAVFTSSVDPTLKELLRSPAREPEVVLTVQETPRAVRSTARPPLYYLFSRAGEHDRQALLPRSRSEYNARRIRHAVPLLDRVLDTATALGLIVVEGFSSGTDWFRLDDLLGIIGNSVPNQVLWFGGRPRFETKWTSNSMKRWSRAASSSNPADWPRWWRSCGRWIGSPTSRHPIRKMPGRSACRTAAAWRRPRSRDCALKR